MSVNEQPVVRTLRDETEVLFDLPTEDDLHLARQTEPLFTVKNFQPVAQGSCWDFAHVPTLRSGHPMNRGNDPFGEGPEVAEGIVLVTTVGGAGMVKLHEETVRIRSQGRITDMGATAKLELGFG